jgi:hypothetical protein
MSSITIKVEPLVPRAERSADQPAGRGSVRVGLVEETSTVDSQAPDLIEPIVGFRNWRIFAGGPTAAELSSPYFPVAWTDPVLHAECRRFGSADALLAAPHAAPDRDCGCGICAYHASTGEFSKVDFRGVSGIVTVWGTIDVDRNGMRAEYARVEALAIYQRWTRRQREAVSEVANGLGVDLVELGELEALAAGYGELLPASLLAEQRTSGMRERFSELFGSRVGV